MQVRGAAADRRCVYVCRGRGVRTVVRTVLAIVCMMCMVACVPDHAARGLFALCWCCLRLPHQQPRLPAAVLASVSPARDTLPYAALLRCLAVLCRPPPGQPAEDQRRAAGVPRLW
jgi:hypothetical protein